MFIQKRKFKNSKGLTLSAIYEGEDKNAPVVVMCHGYQSSKDKETTKALSQKLIEGGLNVFRFDFTGHGQSQGDLADITPLRGVDDLASAVDDLDALGKTKFGLYGSSFGGNVALLYTSQNPVLALALKAPVSDYSQTAKIIDRPHFLDELKLINLYKKVKNIKCPVLIVHGDKDDVVPIKQSKKLLDSLQCDKQLEIIKGAGHDIAGDDLKKAYSQIANFFQQTLTK